MNLFDYDNPTAAQEEKLGRLMELQWQLDKQVVKNRHVVPDWIGEPEPLSKDRARLLELIYQNSYVSWTPNPSNHNVRVAKDMGLNDRVKEGTADLSLLGEDDRVNICVTAKAIIDGCKNAGLVKQTMRDGRYEYEMTLDGEYALEEWQTERELGFV